MPTIGAQMDQLDSLRSTFDQQSSVVDQLTAAIDAQLANTWWAGPAADRFRDAWQSSFAPTLRQLEAALQDSSTELGARHQALLDAGA
jgi:uncharacterized protein YukE